jgi:hypothetical protein
MMMLCDSGRPDFEGSVHVGVGRRISIQPQAAAQVQPQDFAN